MSLFTFESIKNFDHFTSEIFILIAYRRANLHLVFYGQSSVQREKAKAHYSLMLLNLKYILSRIIRVNAIFLEQENDQYTLNDI